MVKTELSIVIKRPVEEVFRFVEDSINDPLWQSGVVESSQTSEGPIGVGATGRQVRRFLGRQVETTAECTEYEPNRRLSVKSTSGPIPMQGTYTFESVEGGTRVTVTGEAQVGSFFKLAGPIVARMLKRQNEVDHKNLKDLLEAQT